MGHGAMSDGPDQHEGRRPQGPTQGPAQYVERGIFQPVQAVAQGAARVIDVGQPGGGDGGWVDVGGRIGPRDERGAGQGRNPEDCVGGRVQTARSLATPRNRAICCGDGSSNKNKPVLLVLAGLLPQTNTLSRRSLIRCQCEPCQKVRPQSWQRKKRSGSLSTPDRTQ